MAFLLEASQGDRISGKISRKEVAAVAVTALGTAASVGEALCLAKPPPVPLWLEAFLSTVKSREWFDNLIGLPACQRKRPEAV